MPRVTHIAVNGLRILDGFALPLHPLNVLIGENGSGKSSLVEACELLRKAATSRDFVDDVYRHHGGRALFRSMPGTMTVAVTLEDGASQYDYSFALGIDGAGSIALQQEMLAVTTDGASRQLLRRDRNSAETHGARHFGAVRPNQLLLIDLQGPEPAFERTRELLAGILVYLPLDTSAMWARREGDSLRGPRGWVTIRSAVAVDRSGDNLPNAYHTLRNRGPEVWERVLDLIRLGLGDDVIDISLPTDPGGGQISLALRIRDLGEVSSRLLSDGQLVYLALVAILMLPPATCPLIVFDEPDHHLHPDLVRRIVGFFEELAGQRTVIVTTHSDRLLDRITDPAGAVVLLSARNHRTLALRPDPDVLTSWLKDYRGIGDLRADGVAGMVFSTEA